MTVYLTDLFLLIVEAAIKGTILIGIIGIVSLLMRRATASIRHAMFSFALASLIAIPIISVVAPPLKINVARTSLPLATSQYNEPPVRETPIAIVNPPPRAAVGQSPSSNLPRGNPAPRRMSLLEALSLLWLGGVIVSALVLIGGLFALRRLSHRAPPAAAPRLVALLQSLKRELNLTRDVQVKIGTRATMPATWGVRRPIIVLPADAEQWTEARQRVVLMHELAHIRRNDWLIQIVALIVSALYWFHPGVRYAARRLRAECELACDEYVLGVGLNACDYAEHILDIASAFRSPVGIAIVGVAMATPSQLERRLDAILSENIGEKWRPSRRGRAAGLAALSILIIPLAAMRPSTRPRALDVKSPLSFFGPTAPDTFRWKGIIPEGEWVEIHSLNGNIRAELSRDGNVEVIATKSGAPTSNVKIITDKSRRSTRFCAVYTSGVSACDETMNDGPRHDANDVRVDFLVRIPAGVGLSAHTGRGNIVAQSVKSYVWGTATEGDIDISTSDLAEASTQVGSVTATFSRRSWKQNLEFYTDKGDVLVYAPADARMVLEAESGSGSVTSEFPVDIRKLGGGARVFTKIGAGGGGLTLRTGRGAVSLKRGPNAVAEVSDIRASSESVDPKPNPNPDPGFNPDPNTTPEIDASEDNPTGERVPFVVPRDLISQLSDARIANYPDAHAIARLRDGAELHVKQQPADLVRERAEWALSLIKNGEIVTPLRAQLSNADWRIRAYAAWALGETQDARATDALTSALRDPHWRVRMHAASALERLGRQAQVQPLISVLNDQYWQVRISAVDALARIGDKRAIEPLRRVAEQDVRSIVREAAASALQRMQ